jgi:hexokinase
MLQAIEKSFRISASDMRTIMRNFRSEMERGLAGRKSSLEMIPSYARRPNGDEKGSFIALDLGGTNFRILELTLKGSGRSARPKTMKFVLKKNLITGSGVKMFDFLAASLKTFLKKNRISTELPVRLGFTFSFPVKQTGIASGTLISWTKGFEASCVIGKDVVVLFKEALARQGLSNIEVSALANDTVGTLVAKSYEDPRCDMGVVIGTGTNACYPEKMTNIKKRSDRGADSGEMIINIEWGNFNKLERNVYDRRLDKASDNPGKQILEKMVSGMYLGEIARIVLMDMTKKGAHFSGFDPSAKAQGQSRASEARRRIDARRFAKPYSFRTEEMSGLAAKSTGPGIKAVLDMVSSRASRIAAACMAAIITKMDSHLSKRHTIAIDGSVYEKYPGFSRKVRRALEELFGKKAGRIKIALAKDSSGKGAAIIAAVAQ